MTSKVAAVLVLLSIVLLPQRSQAQIRGGIIYGTDTGPGIQGGFYFPVPNVNENITFGMDGVFYFPDEGVRTGSEIRSTWAEGNANVQYDAYQTEMSRFYVLAGFHYGYLNEEIIIAGVPTTFEYSEFGANVGVGTKVRFIFGEFRYNIGGLEQANFTIGVHL